MAALYDFMGSGVPNLHAPTDPQKCSTCWERLRSTHPKGEPVTCRSSYLKRLTAPLDSPGREQPSENDDLPGREEPR